ncbi:MAG: hypothetical protein ATN36_00925 [Epulopiscium sp. Nele67-Bin005]|nr:MAG: hypothetical protein ATN36_00925 [Epulopiscium sp. Nele67-Bin005]
MAGIIFNLSDVLTDQIECYEGLYTLSTYKKTAIVNKDLDLLKEVTAREEEFLGRINILNQQRESILKDIALVSALDYKTITITTLVKKIGESKDISIKLLAQRDELHQVLDKVKAQNNQNKQLLAQSMEFVEYNLNAITSTQFEGMTPNYSKPKGFGNSYGGDDSISLFDFKQ